MCNDFLRLGYSKFIADPGVRLAYVGEASHIVYREHIVAAPVTSWADVLAAPIAESSPTQQPQFQYATRAPACPSLLPQDMHFARSIKEAFSALSHPKNNQTLHSATQGCARAVTKAEASGRSAVPVSRRCCSGPQGAVHASADANAEKDCFWEDYLTPNYTDAVHRWKVSVFVADDMSLAVRPELAQKACHQRSHQLLSIGHVPGAAQ